MQIQISRLLQKPTDLDLHCLQRQSISGFSWTRVKLPDMILMPQEKSTGSKFFPFRLDPFLEGSKDKFDRVASHRSIQFTFSYQWAHSADDKLIFFLFFQKIGFEEETICMKCQSRLSGKNIDKKYFKMLSYKFFNQHIRVKSRA